MELQSEPSVRNSVRAAGPPAAQPAGYDHANQHLMDRLIHLDWQLRLLIDNGRARRGSNDVLGFATISEQEVAQLLEPGEPASAGSREDRDLVARRHERHINRRV